MSAHEASLILSKSLSLIEKTRHRVLQIDGTDFPTPSSEEARTLLLNALGSLADKTFWASMSPEALYNALIQLQSLVDDLEASTSDHIFWPLVSYCDHIWKLLFPKTGFRIFYSLTTAHNYTISSFTNQLANRLRHVLPKTEVDRVLGSTALYCLKLASLEDENLPLYANIGHEFGHALYWSHEATLLSLLDDECRSVMQALFKNLQTNEPLLAIKRRQRLFWIVKSLATELFCDLIGAHIAGPAFLLSLHEMAWGTNKYLWSATLVPRDEAIQGNPSFKFRLDDVKRFTNIDTFGSRVRAVFQELFDDPFKELSTYISGIETDHTADRMRVSAVPDSDVDRKAIESAMASNLVELKYSLGRFLDRCEHGVVPGYLASGAFASVSDDQVAELLRRLAHDILPNIIPDRTLLGIPASFATILNASALHRVHLLLRRNPSKSTQDVSKELQKLERLTAKAFEVSYVQKEFNQWKASAKP
jgi:hypothetical protein